MHRRSVSGIGIAALGILIAFLQLLATRYFLYFELWWFDIPMHFLGGLFIGSAFLWAWRFEPIVKRMTPLSMFMSAFLATLTIGIAWEIFEYVTDSYAAANYTLDTALDLLMDIFGMAAAYLLFKFTRA